MTRETRQFFALGTFEFPFVQAVSCGGEGGDCQIDPHSIGYKMFLYPAAGRSDQFVGYSVDVLGPATVMVRLEEGNSRLPTLRVEKTYIYPHQVLKGQLTFILPTKGWEEREVRDGQRVRMLLADGIYNGTGRSPDGTVYLGHASLVLFDAPLAVTSRNLVLLQGVLGMTEYFNSEQMLKYLFYTPKSTT